ncbi:MAG: sensor histidine kinase [bacterium]
MAESTSNFERRSIEHPWRVFGYTTLFCTGIGILITLLAGGNAFANLAVSFSIGWSISACFHLLGPLFDSWLGPYVGPAPVTAIGLAIGMVIAGLITYQDPLVFFTFGNATIYLGVFFGILGFIFFGTRARMVRAEADLARANARQAQQEKLLAETELKLLQAQIEPHFLFNTLSNIVGLIHENPDTAEKTLLNLTTLLRGSLNRTRQQATTLGQELEIAQAYLEIQSTRMQGRLGYAFDVPAELNNTPLPPLLVQPLIENAIKHGIEPCEDGGEISVHAIRQNTDVLISIADTGVGITQDHSATRATAGSGTGLRNVRERLHTLYGSKAQLDLLPNEPQGVIARITLPALTETDEGGRA